MTDVYSPHKRSEIMSRVRNKKTGIENDVAVILRALKFRFKRNIRSLPGQPDFVIPLHRTVVFVHGCFWHGHFNCERAKLPSTNRAFWKKKIQTNKKRDRANFYLLRKRGWHIFTIWQCKMKNKAGLISHLLRIKKCS